MQTLKWRTEQGLYYLTQSHLHPTYWSANLQDNEGGFAHVTREIRGVQAVLAMIKEEFPPFYAYLLEQFPEEQGVLPLDVSAILGYEHVKYPLEIAVAGGHDILLIGSPTNPVIAQLAEAYESIYRRLTSDERSIIFIDLNDFDLETIHTIIEAHNSVLIASIKPCPCGFYDDPTHICTCERETIVQYQQEIGHMMHTGFALEVWVPSNDPDHPSPEITKMFPPDSSAIVQSRVQIARQIQEVRYKDTDLSWNADACTTEDVGKYCAMNRDASDLVRIAIRQLQLTPVKVTHLQVVARTIADLGGGSLITGIYMAKAIVYRSRFGQLG